MSEQEEKKEKKPKVPRQKMPEQDPIERAQNFYEVALGYDNDLALLEASRCLHCKKPYCISGCPVEVDIPDFLEMVKAGDIIGASWKVKEKKNSLPRIAGRVCPQESQCEAKCVLYKKGKGEPCGIGRLERFVADYAAVHGGGKLPGIAEAHWSEGGSGRFGSCRSYSWQGLSSRKASESQSLRPCTNSAGFSVYRHP